jgi:hypothetical protein
VFVGVSRLAILYHDWLGVKKLLARAKTICEAGGDWEHKNKLKVSAARSWGFPPEPLRQERVLGWGFLPSRIGAFQKPLVAAHRCDRPLWYVGSKIVCSYVPPHP